MRATKILIALAAVLWIAGAEAQVLRNPVGTGTLGGPTRGPTGTSSTPAPSAKADSPPAMNASPTRPPLGSNVPSPPGAAGGPNLVTGRPTGTGGIGTGATPATSGGLPPNGGTATNGSKPAPMRPDGVREVK